MDIKTLQQTNARRAYKWHGESEPWTTVDWTNALAGEAGEACNKSKKLKRINTNLLNKEAGISKNNKFELQRGVAEECADAIIYAVLTIDHLGFEAEEIIRYVFNKKSEEYGFEERL